MKSRTLITVLLIAGLLATAPYAQEKKAGTSTTAIQAPEHVDLTGTLVCLGCSLKKAEGARSACSVYGHRHALKTDDGKFITFLENKYSDDLIKGEKYADKRLQVHGIYYANANQLDVENFTVDGTSITWCERHGAMDACASGSSGK